MPVRHRGRRRHADGGNAAVRSLKPHGGMDMIVPVQDQIDAMPLHERQERVGVGQPLVLRF